MGGRSASGSFAALRMTATTQAKATAAAAATATATATATAKTIAKARTKCGGLSSAVKAPPSVEMTPLGRGDFTRCGLSVEGVPDQDEGEGGDDDRCGPGDYVEPAGVGVFAHQVVLVDELQHEDQDQGQEDAVQYLREDAELDQREVRDKDYRCAGEEEQAVEPVEELRFAEPFVETAFKAEALADGVGGGEREDRCGEERGVEEAGGEEDKGIVTGQRLHRLGGVGGVYDVAYAVSVEGGGAGDDDEPGDDVGEDGADDDVEARGLVLFDADALSTIEDCR